MDSLDYASYGTGGLAYDWADKLMLRSNIHAALKNRGDALRDLRRAMDVVSTRAGNGRFRYHWLYAYRLAQSGQFTEAAKTIEELRMVSEEGGLPRAQYLCAKGIVALEQGQASDAVTLLDTAVNEANEFFVAFMLGRAYLNAGQFGSAIDLYQKELSRYDVIWRRLFPIWRLEIHYYLGLAYEGTGDTRQAAEQYRKFLDAWKDADRGIPVLEDAELRLHAFEAGS